MTPALSPVEALQDAVAYSNQGDLRVKRLADLGYELRAIPKANPEELRRIQEMSQGDWGYHNRPIEQADDDAS